MSFLVISFGPSALLLLKIRRPEEQTVIDVQDDLISQLRRDPAAATERARIARTIPHLLLLEAADQKANLRWIGKQNYAGKQHDVIGFPLPNTKTTLALFFATDTHLLSKYEYDETSGSIDHLSCTNGNAASRSYLFDPSSLNQNVAWTRYREPRP